MSSLLSVVDDEISTRLSLSLFVSRVSLLSENERHGRKLIGRETRGLNALEKSLTIFFFFFFFFSLLVRKKGRKNGGNYGQARDVSWKGEKIWWTWYNNGALLRAISIFYSRLIAKTSFHIWYSARNAFPPISICHSLLAEILQPAVVPAYSRF